MTTTKLGLTETANGQANYLNVNEALACLDQLVQGAVLDKDLATPPSSPANGAAYIVATSPTGAWVGQAGKIAYWLSSVGVWTFVTPQEGFFFHVSDENAFYSYDGSAWAIFTGAGMANPMTTAGDLIRGGTSGAPARLAPGTNGYVLTMVGGVPDWAASGSSATQSIIIACSDEDTALTAGTNKVTFRMPYGFTLSAVRASLATAQVSGSILTVDINEGGATVLSTKLTIDNTEKTSTTAATAAVISDTALADDAEITIDIDQVGDGTAKGLKVVLIGVKV